MSLVETLKRLMRRENGCAPRPREEVDESTDERDEAINRVTTRLERLLQAEDDLFRRRRP